MTPPVTAMLRLTPGNAAPAAERVLTQRVLRADGRAWAPAREAEVLLLGDSFTNVFSVPALGWGSGAFRCFAPTRTAP